MNSEFIVAVHSLVYLAYRPDHMANSETIAENVNTHPARVRKIMGMMRRAGYVGTKEGTGGGFMLECRPEEIRLSDIYRIVSMGSIKPTWCSGSQDKDCIISCNMENVMNNVFYEAEMSMIRSLEKVNVAEMLERVKLEDLRSQERSAVKDNPMSVDKSSSGSRPPSENKPLSVD